jgi:hypothetical protein
MHETENGYFAYHQPYVRLDLRRLDEIAKMNFYRFTSATKCGPITEESRRRLADHGLPDRRPTPFGIPPLNPISSRSS